MYTLELGGHSVFVRSNTTDLAENQLSGKIGIIRQRNHVISPARSELDRVIASLPVVLKELKSNSDHRRHGRINIGHSEVSLDLSNDAECTVRRIAQFWRKAALLLQVADTFSEDVQQQLSVRRDVPRFTVDIGCLGLSAEDTLGLCR